MKESSRDNDRYSESCFSIIKKKKYGKCIESCLRKDGVLLVKKIVLSVHTRLVVDKVVVYLK